MTPNERVMLLAQTQNREVAQRKRVFYTRANITGTKKQLLVIVDSGCTKNLVSEEVVKQMGWQTQPHPKPYSMGWVQEGHEVRLNRQVQVPFEIGTYKEEVRCDVFSMGLCDMLLGRPWQYDRDTHHEGHLHTYTVRLPDRHIRLWPMKSNDIVDYMPMFRDLEGECVKCGEKNKSNASNMLVSPKQFTKITRESSHCCMVMLRSCGASKGDEAKLSDRFQSMLDEIGDIMVKDLPKELPPLREVEHKIDFIPGCSISNRVAYRYSLMEQEEVRR